MIQHRAVRYIFNDYSLTSSVSAMLKRRKITSFVMLYKIKKQQQKKKKKKKKKKTLLILAFHLT